MIKETYTNNIRTQINNKKKNNFQFTQKRIDGFVGDEHSLQN